MALRCIFFGMVSEILPPEPQRFTETEIRNQILKAAILKVKKAFDAQEYWRLNETNLRAQCEKHPINSLPLQMSDASTGRDPNHKTLTLSSPVGEVGYLFISHAPITAPETREPSPQSQASRLSSILKKLRRSFATSVPQNIPTLTPLNEFRETLQFLNSDGETLFIEESDGSLKISVSEIHAESFSLGKNEQLNSGTLFPESVRALFGRLHEYGHAFRYSGMTKTQQLHYLAAIYTLLGVSQPGQATISETDSNQVLEDLKKYIFEEIAASASAVYRLNEIFTFMGLYSPKVHQVLVDYSAHILGNYLANSAKYIDLRSISSLTDWLSSPTPLEITLTPLAKRFIEEKKKYG